MVYYEFTMVCFLIGITTTTLSFIYNILLYSFRVCLNDRLFTFVGEHKEQSILKHNEIVSVSSLNVCICLTTA